MTTIVAPPWEEQPTVGGIADAPTDGKTYGRKDAAWAEVVSAALPLPDVWAPLSDSLRMITGYGREVKVGDDVVSQMVNFSRSTTATYIGKDGQLKTAAVNEPRFEKEGLLIEGQSTNLFLYSKSPDSYPWYANGDTSYIKIEDGVRITGVGYYSYQVLPVIAGQAYTFSVTCKVLSGTLNKVGLEGDATITLGSGLTPENGTVRLSGTVTPNVNGYVSCVYYPTQNSVVEFTDIQFEALPFASSYIPTNGAAVTRAADQAWLPISNTSIGGGVSVAAECDVLAPYNTYPRVAVGKGLPDLFCAPPSLWIPSLIPSLNNIKVAYSKNHQCFNGVLFSHQINLSDDNLAQQISLLSQYSNGWSTGFGHIRNLRIWHRDLSIEQLKAVA